MSGDAERSFPPTARRLAKARSHGNVARSACAAAALTLVSSAAVSVTLATAAEWWVNMARRSALRAAAAPHASAPELLATAASVMHSAPPWLVVAFAWLCASGATVVAAASCGGLSPAWSSLRIDSRRISWSAGAKKLAALDGAGAMLALLGAAAIAMSSGVAVHAWAGIAAQQADFSADVAALGAALTGAWRVAAPAAIILGAADVALQRGRHLRNLRMTARELKEERVEHEGRPEIKARRRHAAVKRARGLRIGAIRQATAVVTNPTHIAVALRYDPPRIDVPVVVARGADMAAALVRGAAESFGVPVVEAPELARMLYAQTESDCPIPEEAYVAVAAVFAWILRTRGALPGSACGNSTGSDTP